MYHTNWSTLIDSSILHTRAAGIDMVILNSFDVAIELLERRSAIYSSRYVSIIPQWCIISIPSKDQCFPLWMICKLHICSCQETKFLIKMDSTGWVLDGYLRLWCMEIVGENIGAYFKDIFMRKISSSIIPYRWNRCGKCCPVSAKHRVNFWVYLVSKFILLYLVDLQYDY